MGKGAATLGLRWKLGGSTLGPRASPQMATPVLRTGYFRPAGLRSDECPRAVRWSLQDTGLPSQRWTSCAGYWSPQAHGLPGCLTAGLHSGWLLPCAHCALPQPVLVGGVSASVGEGTKQRPRGLAGLRHQRPWRGEWCVHRKLEQSSNLAFLLAFRRRFPSMCRSVGRQNPWL